MTDRDERLCENGAGQQVDASNQNDDLFRRVRMLLADGAISPGQAIDAINQTGQASVTVRFVEDNGPSEEVTRIPVGMPPTQSDEAERNAPATPGMTRAEFDVLIESDLNAYLRGLRDEKEAEYANGADTLLNFHLAGPFLGLTPAQYAMVLLTKHVQGIAKQVMAGNWRWAYHTEDGGEGLKQRLADLKNYADLLFALLSEEAASR